MLRSIVCRVAFSPSMYWASSLARSGRSVTNSSTANCGWPSRPAAFSRGAIWKPRSSAAQPHLSVGVLLRGDLGDVHQRGQPERRRIGQTLQPMTHQHAVLIDQRHDVGHGAQGGQPDGLHEKILHSRGDPLGPGGLLAERPGQFHRHARAAQTAERILAARQSRMNDRRGLGQTKAGLVVVGDDQFDAQFPGEDRLVDAADAAIDGHQQFALVGGQRADGLAVEPVAFVDAMGNVVAHVGAEQFQAEPEDRRAGHAVDVVIAVDEDSLSGGDGGMDAPAASWQPGNSPGSRRAESFGSRKSRATAGSVTPRQINNSATTAGIAAARWRAAMRAGSCGWMRSIAMVGLQWLVAKWLQCVSYTPLAADHWPAEAGH